MIQKFIDFNLLFFGCNYKIIDWVDCNLDMMFIDNSKPKPKIFSKNN